ncbi:MAG: DUF2723 domain-containing protein [Anaerolineae bacterium]|nr:DUF2723 domain-containing protein [Anaerolineae bacterium]
MSPRRNLCCGLRRGKGGPCHHLVIVGAIFFLGLALYILTLAPDLSWAHWGADGGDLAVAAVTGRLPHPPGAPLYVLLTRAWLRLPWGGSPAWRLNLFSAVMAALTAALFAALLLRRGDDLAVALMASLSLVVAPLFWSQALITEVYSTAALFAMLTLTLAWDSLKTLRRAFLGGLVWGLGLSVHPVLLFLAPLWLSVPRRSFPALAGGVLVGLLPYALLPVMGDGLQPWGDLHSLAGWWEFVTARLYWGYAFALPWAHVPQRLLAWAVLLVRQFTPAGMLFALLGLRASWQNQKSLLCATGAAFGMASLYAIGYNTTDSLVYLVPYLTLPALWLADGLKYLLAQPAWRRLRWWGLLLPLVVVVWQWNALDLSRDATVGMWLEAALEQAPANAVLVTASDGQTFALWYAQEVLGLRLDITVVDRDLWARSSYREFLGASVDEPVGLETFFAGRRLIAIPLPR